MPISRDEFVQRYPILYHVSLARDVATIRKHGLRSASSLLDLFEITGRRRVELERHRRNNVVPLQHPVHGIALLNDHSPLQHGPLSRSLQGMSEEEWIMELNRRVFFFPRYASITKFSKAARTRSCGRILVQVKAASLFDINPESIHLSPINAGAAVRNAPVRGKTTFASLGDYPFEEWRKKRRGFAKAISEVTFLDLVPPGDHFEFATI